MAIIKSGKVVVLLNGRYAGRKAVVVRSYESGNADRRFSHVLVAGIDRYPRKVTKKMSKEKVDKKSKIKPFVKYINVTHIMPTRYMVDVDLKQVVDENSYNNNRVDVRKAVKRILEDRYRNQGESKSDKRAQGNKFLFTKLRF